jgi:large subunit ribosomal protein L10
MRKDQKIQFVEEWSKEISEIPYAVLVDFRGLSVAKAAELRSRIREANSTYKVVKNNLARRSVPGTALEPLAEHFEGPCGIAYNDHDPIVLAKTLVEFRKDNPTLEIKIGVVDGQLIEAADVKQLSRTPGREELLAKLLYLLTHPLQGLASALNNIVGSLAVVVRQVAEGKE